MSSLAVPKDQQSAFQDFLIDIPAAAPGTRLPFHVLGALQNLQRGDKDAEWKVGHVHPIGWYVLNAESGGLVWVENQLALPAFFRLWQAKALKRDKTMDALHEHIKKTREGIDQDHVKREHDKHMADMRREYFGVTRSTVYHNPVPNEYGVAPPDEEGNTWNQQKPAGITSGATPDPANPNIEGEKAASTSSISSDSAGLPGNKTMQPHGSPDAVAPLRTAAVEYGDSGEIVNRQTEPNAQGETDAPPPQPAGGDADPNDANPGLRAAARSGADKDTKTRTVTDTSMPAPKK